MGAFYGLKSCVVNLASVGTVDDYAGHAVGDGAVGKVFYMDLIFRGCGISPEIAFDNQYEAQLTHCGKINAFIAHAGGLSAITNPCEAGQFFALNACAE